MPEKNEKKRKESGFSSKRRYHGNLYLSIGVAILALLLLYVLIPTQSTSYVTRTGFGARTFPRFIGYSLIVISLLTAIVHFLSPEEERHDLSAITVHELLTILPVLAIMVLSSIGMAYIGFYLSFGLGLLVTMLFLGDRSIKNMALSIAFFLLFTFLVLEVFLKFKLPTGSLFG